MAKIGVVQLAASRVKVLKAWPKAPEIRICRFDDCAKPCIEACPVEAISVKEGIVVIDRDACTGCGACVEECPYGAIYIDQEGLAFKCDFCGGDPACVKECVTGALVKMGAGK